MAGSQRQQIRTIFADCALTLNDRFTNKILGLWGDANNIITGFVAAASEHRWTVTAVTGTLRIQDPTRSTQFLTIFPDQWDLVELLGFTPAANNNGLWRIVDAGNGTSFDEPFIILEPMDGQTPASGTSGTSTSPAGISKRGGLAFDNVNGTPLSAIEPITVTLQVGVTYTFQFTPKRFQAQKVVAGQIVSLVDSLPAGANGDYEVDRVISRSVGNPPSEDQEFLFLKRIDGQPLIALTGFGTATDPAKIFASNPFRAVYFKGLEFRKGARDQAPGAVMEAALGPADIPGFGPRSMAYLEEFNLTEFGNRMPTFQALLEVTPTEHHGNIIATLMRRAGWAPASFGKFGVPEYEISPIWNTDSVQGYHVRGSIETIKAIQPLMIAFDTVMQERGTRLRFIKRKDAESVRVRLSDLGAHEFGAGLPQPFTVSELGEDRLPTRVNVSYHDLQEEQQVAVETYGFRSPGVNPLAKEGENVSNINLIPLVLTRTQAKDIATDLFQRSWVNRESVTIPLPPSYIHVLENDLLTFSQPAMTLPYKNQSASFTRGEIITATSGGTAFIDQIPDDQSGTDGFLRLTNIDGAFTKNNVVTDGAGGSASITTTTKPRDYVVRVQRIDRGADFRLLVEGIVEDLDIAVIGSPSEPYPIPRPITTPDAPVTMVAIQVPVVTAMPMMNFAVSPTNGDSDFTGLGIYETRDDGATWAAVAACVQPTQIGYTQASVSSFAGGAHWDLFNTISVDLPHGTFESTTRDRVLQGFNWVLIEDEVIGFSTAVLGADGLWTLSDLARNMTGSGAVGHTSGKRIVFVSGFRTDPCHIDYQDFSRLGETVEFRALLPGQEIEDGASHTVTLTHANARARGPAHLECRKVGTKTDGGILWEIRWMRVSRNPYPTFAGLQPPLVEDYEEYEFEFYDSVQDTEQNLVGTMNLSARSTGSREVERRIFLDDLALADIGVTLPDSDTRLLKVFHVGAAGRSPAAAVTIPNVTVFSEVYND